MTPVMTECDELSLPYDTVLDESPDFSLPQTLLCGQAFRWRQLDQNTFIGAAFEKVCQIAQTNGKIVVSCQSAGDFDAVWRGYFDLDRDYGALKNRFRADPALAEAVAKAPGIRVLRQQPWEALCTFIISQNNNIPRITGIVGRMCAAFGRPLGGGWHAFPTPEAIAALAPDALAPLRAGFRARYLVDAARRVVSGEVDLEALGTLPLDEAQAMLTRITGVGVKVAACTLLYGCGRVECVPVDVWMRRVLDRLYPGGITACTYGYEGIAQQSLFHCARTDPGFLDRAARGRHRLTYFEDSL